MLEKQQQFNENKNLNNGLVEDISILTPSNKHILIQL